MINLIRFRNNWKISWINTKNSSSRSAQEQETIHIKFNN